MNHPDTAISILKRFERYLEEEEKSKATIEKYIRDIRKFYEFLDGAEIDKEHTIAYKKYLAERYAATSVNSMLVALNCFLRFSGLQTCCIKLLKIQRQIFAAEDHELSKEEYQNLLKAAKSAKNDRLFLLLQTMCGTGIRVSELRYITVEAIRRGKAVVNCKNKTRVIFIPVPLQKLLKEYSKKTGIQAGPVFVSKNGKPLDRSNIWRDMKSLCKQADVPPKKVFPHNLRHLFARTFYSVEKDIVRLADLLGHSSINTTRIYTMETGFQHVNRLEQVQVLLTT
ncbi:tyrosine-type recombinase/integrase [Solibaculum mannosilyticum]|uniref:Integrase n=1 Tax=Solibaculum mannosilyticum TaxID=2780922 RepID=A0A7I8CYF6_9FIRM|nr:tyrosine-type recombinase/integrase [Solibaculum mannosilyticum]BCI59426.1 integrase [Solibaculum mannosilyticum]CZT55209.1 Tyrosine recombinase XerD [Eubacteriaceae bacterium CHKCI005]